MAEETVEKLDQEITLNLQKIDSNLSYCFGKITKQIIPRVARYGAVCEDIMDHSSWLGAMFQQTGSVELNMRVPSGGNESSASLPPPETLFPLSSGGRGERPLPVMPRSDDDAAEAEGSTLQRQRRRRKVSLLLQQEFGSSSSAVPSPVATAQRDGAALRRPDSSTEEYQALIDSSPMKQPEPADADESTKQVPRPGTVIHFSTGV